MWWICHENGFWVDIQTVNTAEQTDTGKCPFLELEWILYSVSLYMPLPKISYYNSE